MAYESPQQHGWNEDYSLEWVNETFPTDIGKRFRVNPHSIVLEIGAISEV